MDDFRREKQRDGAHVLRLLPKDVAQCADGHRAQADARREKGDVVLRHEGRGAKPPHLAVQRYKGRDAFRGLG